MALRPNRPGGSFPPAPPPEFDYEPEFKYSVMSVSPEKVKAYCRGDKQACAIPKRRVIVISDELKGPEREAYLRHEKAHLNGWLDCRETIIHDDDDHDEAIA